MHDACTTDACSSNLLAGLAALHSLLQASSRPQESTPSLAALLLHHLPMTEEQQVLDFLDALRPASLPLRDWRAMADAAIVTASVLEHDVRDYRLRPTAVQALGAGVVVVGGSLAGGVLDAGLAPLIAPYHVADDVPHALELLEARPHTPLLFRPTNELARAVVGDSRFLLLFNATSHHPQISQLSPVLPLSPQCPEWEPQSWVAQPTAIVPQRTRLPVWLLHDERGMHGVAMREVAWRLGCPAYSLRFDQLDWHCSTWSDLADRYAVGVAT